MGAVTRRALLLGALALPFVTAVPIAKRRKYDVKVPYDTPKFRYNQLI